MLWRSICYGQFTSLAGCNSVASIFRGTVDFHVSSFLYADVFRLLNCTQQFSMSNAEALGQGSQPDWFMC